MNRVPSIIDQAIVTLLDEAVKLSDDGQKWAIQSLLRLLRSGKADAVEIERLAGELMASWGPEVRRYYLDLCRKLGLCD